MEFSYFSVIGAQRSGSTSVYNYLDAHPEILMNQPAVPEPKYFVREEHTLSREDYLSQFFPDISAESRFLGDKSTSYYENAGAALRMHDMFPDAKIILSLRDPVERALSNYFFSRAGGLETRTLEEVFLEKAPKPVLKREISIDPFDYLGRGEYVRFLAPWFEQFGRENVYILNFNQFILTPHECYRELLTFLGVNNVEHVPENLGKTHNSEKRSQDVPDEVIQVLRAHFKPWNEKLSKDIGFDVNLWDPVVV